MIFNGVHGLLCSKIRTILVTYWSIFTLLSALLHAPSGAIGICPSLHVHLDSVMQQRLNTLCSLYYYYYYFLTLCSKTNRSASRISSEEGVRRARCHKCDVNVDPQPAGSRMQLHRKPVFFNVFQGGVFLSELLEMTLYI